MKLAANPVVGKLGAFKRRLLRGRLGPRTFLRKDGEAGLISRDSILIKRHRNPLGIFSRAIVYPLMGYGAWRHRLELVVAGVALEALLWTAVPPVDETFRFVEEAIETELDWLNAPAGPQKPSRSSCWLYSLLPCSRACGGAPGVCSPRPQASSLSSTC